MSGSFILYEFLNFKTRCCFFRLCPVFQVSNVSGENLDLLKMFMNLLTTRTPTYENEHAEFQIDDTYSVPVSVFRIIHSRFFMLPHPYSAFDNISFISGSRNCSFRHMPERHDYAQ